MKIKAPAPFALVLLSGFSCLVFQLLWMRQLGLLFGNTAHAAAMTLAIFFAGLALGGWFWGDRSAKTLNPMLAFAGLEAGIAVTALLYFFIISLFQGIYPSIYQNIASPPLFLAVKCLLACLLIMPPAFFMGGTLPMIGQAVIRDRNTFGRKAAGLYAVNTIGAALGAFTAGFFLVRLTGFTWTCIIAITISAANAAAAYLMANKQNAGAQSPPSGFNDKPNPSSSHTSYCIYAICFLSGFGFLALEVLWTHLLAQIHTNSVYSFSTVLVIVLLSLALGSAAASKLAKLNANPARLLAVLLLSGGIAVTLCPFVLIEATNGFTMLFTGGTILQFILDLLGKGALIIGIPAFFLAMVFPFLIKAAESYTLQPGSTLGRLSAINTAGSIAGALLCGFVFIELFGMWRTMQIIAALYLIAGLLLPPGSSISSKAIRFAGAIALMLLFTWLSPVGLQVTGKDPARPPERIIELWETSYGTVSVNMVEGSGCVIKMNSNYWLGSTGAAWRQHFQGRIPLLAYPRTRSVFFLGMGTGISVGGALDPRFKQVERVVACELVPAVVTAARKYMTGNYKADPSGNVDFTSGLFDDERVEIAVQDGRHYLMASGEKFDMINCDLFLPYQQGTGSLYSREHFENAKASLTTNGVFVQWLPMFQLTEFEFGVIAKTMLTVFDQVTAWRNNFQPGQEALALVGHRRKAPLPPSASDSIESRIAVVAGKDPMEVDLLDITFDEENVPVFYCGNLTASKDLFRNYPLNTDDRPVIEYAAPLSMRKKVDGFVPTMVGPRLVSLVDSLIERCPPESDPMLDQRSPANRRLTRAGAELHRFWTARAMNDRRNAENAWTRFVREWTNQEALNE